MDSQKKKGEIVDRALDSVMAPDKGENGQSEAWRPVHHQGSDAVITR